MIKEVANFYYVEAKEFVGELLYGEPSSCGLINFGAGVFS